MNNDKTNETQIEELDDEQLQEAQGGSKIGDDWPRSRLTSPELAGVRKAGSKLRDNGTKLRPGIKGGTKKRI